MKKKPRITKAQQRIAQKYSNIIEALDFRQEVQTKVGKRGYNKYVSDIANTKKTIKQLSSDVSKLNTEIKRLQIEGLDAKPTIKKLFDVEDQIRLSKDKKYELDLVLRSAPGYIKVEGKKIDTDLSLDLTEEEEAAIRDIKNRLDSYSEGDRVIDRFYHTYGFDTITNYSLRLFAKGEGLL